MHRFFIVLIIVTCLTGCAAYEPELPAYNPTGVSGKRAAEAERLYGFARILWKDKEHCSDPEKAVAYLSKALTIEPQYADAYTRRGLAYSELGMEEEALADMINAVRVEPTADNYAYRGLVYMRQGNHAAAKQDLAYSLSLNARQYRAWLFKGALALLEEQTEEACDAFSEACSNGDCSALEAGRKEGICSESILPFQ